jgi:hypothetical protein
VVAAAAVVAAAVAVAVAVVGFPLSSRVPHMAIPLDTAAPRAPSSTTYGPTYDTGRPTLSSSGKQIPTHNLCPLHARGP